MGNIAKQTGIKDLVGGGGSTAAKLLNNGFDLSVLRTNDLLRKDEWKALDTAVVRVARERLVAIQDLRNAGLTRNLGGLGVLIDEYEKLSDIEPAEQSMTGVAPSERDLAEYSLTGVPVPITFKDFEVNARLLAASRNRGSSIDTVNAEMAGRKVAEKLEDTLFNGSSVVIGGNTLYGYTNHPDRTTGSLTGDWSDTATVAGTDILDDVLEMIEAEEALNFFGGWTLYVPTDYNARLRNEFKTNSDKTIRDRLMEIDTLDAIRVSTSLTGGASGEVVLVQMTSDVVDLSIGQDVTTVQWSYMGGLVESFKVMAAIAPRIKSNADGTTGIAHYSV